MGHQENSREKPFFKNKNVVNKRGKRWEIREYLRITIARGNGKLFHFHSEKLHVKFVTLVFSVRLTIELLRQFL